MEKVCNFDTLACLADFDNVGDPSGPKTPLEKGADAVFVKKTVGLYVVGCSRGCMVQLQKAGW